MTKEAPVNVTPTAIAVAIAVVVAIGFLFFGSAIFTPFSPPAGETMEMTADSNNQGNGTSMITDTVVGTGEVAVPGKTVTLNYVGMFEDGTIFDASERHGQPISFVLGQGMVIQGWEQGIEGMKVGGKRHLVIPPELAYGAAGRGSIPPNSTLVFDVELLEVR